jgi:hypothetical protein
MNCCNDTSIDALYTTNCYEHTEAIAKTNVKSYLSPTLCNYNAVGVR